MAYIQADHSSESSDCDERPRKKNKPSPHTSDVRGVAWDQGAKAWAAIWFEDGKRVCRRFSTHQHTFEEAKQLAETARLDANARGAGMKKFKSDVEIPSDPAMQRSSLKGVSFSVADGNWAAAWMNPEGKRITRKFSVVKHGSFQAAKAAAEAARTEAEQLGQATKLRLHDGSRLTLSRNSHEADMERPLSDYETIPGVLYDRKRGVWKARWTPKGERGYRVPRQFDVSTYGFHEAKRMAFEARRQALAEGATHMTSALADYTFSPAKHQCDVVGVTWNETTERWVATWTNDETGKVVHKTFNAKAHGFEAAKKMAIQARKAADESGEARAGRVAVPKGSTPFQSEVSGVCYSEAGGSAKWIATWKNGNTSHTKGFAVHRYGFDDAKALAEKARLAAEVRGDAAPTNIK